MDKMIVVVFEDERSAYEGIKALGELDQEGSITLYATAVLAKDAAGNVTVKRAAEAGGIGSAVGMLSGSLVGLVAGPVGLVAGLGVGALGGLIYDLSRLGVDGEFLRDAAAALAPGRFAVLGEIGEEWVTPLDARIEALHGTVLRRLRSEVVDAQLERDITTLKGELSSLKAEAASAASERRAKLQARVEEARGRLRAAEQRARAALEGMQQETEAKLAALQARLTRAQGAYQEKLEQRVTELRRQYKERSEKLAKAWAMAREALS